MLEHPHHAMNLLHVLLGTTLLIALALRPAWSQAGAPGEPGPRLLSPSEQRDSATAPGDMRPERPVTPQISVPLARKPAAPPPDPTRAGAAAEDDPVTGLARCATLKGEQVRQQCKDKEARRSRRGPPH